MSSWSGKKSLRSYGETVSRDGGSFLPPSCSTDMPAKPCLVHNCSSKQISDLGRIRHLTQNFRM